MSMKCVSPDLTHVTSVHNPLTRSKQPLILVERVENFRLPRFMQKEENRKMSIRMFHSIRSQSHA